MTRLPCLSSLALLAALVSGTPPRVLADEIVEQRELARRHYERVRAELGGADQTDWDSAQRAARRELLVTLDDYARRADFGVQRDVRAPRPIFVDEDGRRCAVAELLHATGEDELVAAVASAINHAWIVDLAEEARFRRWLDANGLTLWEAARIQAYPGGVDRPLKGDCALPPPAPPPPPYRGPMRPVPLTGGVSGAGPSSSQREITLEAGWWSWWDYNSVEFLRPNRLRERVDDSGRTYVALLETARRALLPSLLEALAHPDAHVRAAAALAAGRSGGAAAVESLRALFDDPSSEVREMAILGLGATGVPAAQALLVELAREGRIGRGEKLGNRARATAIVALGIGRLLGFDVAADDAVAAITGDRRAAEKEPLGVAAMTHALLRPSPVLLAVARELATDSSEPVAVRCRAIEVLRENADARTLSTLQHVLSGARLDMRRSAALALGDNDHPLATAALMTAHELEREPLTRGFLLVALGRQGGDAAREYLVDALENGDDMDRPWAALALGLVARARYDPRATLALREGAITERRTLDRGAYWLALGLARDVRALDMLRDALVEATDADSRVYAAQALAMLRCDEGRAALLAALETERSPFVRSQLALAIGIHGEPGDVAMIDRVLEEVSAPELQSQAASSMAFHGSAEALQRIVTLCRDEATSDAERAASIDALGMMTSDVVPFAFGTATRSSNFTMFDDWIARLATTTL